MVTRDELAANDWNLNIRRYAVATFWTVAMLVLAIAHKLKVALSPSPVRGVLHGKSKGYGDGRVSSRWTILT